MTSIGKALLHVAEVKTQFAVSISKQPATQMLSSCITSTLPNEFLDMAAKRKSTRDNDDISHRHFLNSGSDTYNSDSDQDETQTDNTK